MKNKLVKATATTAVPFVNVIHPGDQLDPAGRINYFHELSRQAGEISIRAALFAGMELFREKLTRQGTFNQWVEQNCDFSRVTAYKYLALVQQAIGSHEDLVALIDKSDETRRKTVEEYSAKVESKNVTEMMCDYGIITRSKSNLGGRREGAGRPRKVAAAELAAQAEAVAAKAGAVELQKTVGELFVLAVSNDGFGAFETPLLREAVETLEQVVRRAKAILDSRKGARKGKTLAEVLQ